MPNTISFFRRSLPLALLVAIPSLAQAHPGHGTANGFLEGAAHPAMGLDHLCALIAVGLWAAQRQGRALWMVPLAFVSVMALGSVLAMSGLALPLAQTGIVASVLILGVMIAAAARLPLAASSVLVGAFALFHGFAHGAEMPQGVSGAGWVLGFVSTTVALHAAGLGLGLMMQQVAQSQAIRYAGAVIAGLGVYLCFV